EWEARALVAAVDLLQVHAIHGRVGLLADEELLLEWTELAAGQVAVDAARGLAHLLVARCRVGKQDARRHELRDFLRLGHDSAAALGYRRSRAKLGVQLVGVGIPLEAVGMAGEAALHELFEAAGAVPGALVVGVEDIALGVEADAAGRAHAAGGRDELAVRR